MERQFLTFEKNLVTKRRQRKKRKRIKSHTADYHNWYLYRKIFIIIFKTAYGVGERERERERERETLGGMWESAWKTKGRSRLEEIHHRKVPITFPIGKRLAKLDHLVNTTTKEGRGKEGGKDGETSVWILKNKPTKAQETPFGTEKEVGRGGRATTKRESLKHTRAGTHKHARNDDSLLGEQSREHGSL